MDHTGTPEQHLTALLDAEHDNDWDRDRWDAREHPRCLAVGPKGSECHRDAGHHDDAWPVDKHVSFDYGRYQDWPVGWKPVTERIKDVCDPTFAERISGNADYRRGAADVLALVRSILTAGGPG